MPKNYYIILGVPEDSTQADIKNAYRKLAKEFHPDHHGNNQSRFQIIHEAYRVLSDPTLRRNYDKILKGRIQVEQHRRAGSSSLGKDDMVEPLIPEERTAESTIRAVDRSIHHYGFLFDSLFDRMLTDFTESTMAEGVRLKSMTVEVLLTREQAAKGGNVHIRVPVRLRCPSCRSQTGTGFHNCWRCSGAGYLTGEKTVLVNYPAGLQSQHTMYISIGPDGRRLEVIFSIQ
ncbi:J domain-containing protein [Desulfosediminicola ganghwensis]|uniref:J domain-containing protein n=1 Tax=Desulfosediminicola ganghwensis TaxID=2569540 RepID=UPI0010AD76FA|nr:DnaJ domain-containing protein [Desulfosediminicola ganghwensis]